MSTKDAILDVLNYNWNAEWDDYCCWIEENGLEHGGRHVFQSLVLLDVAFNDSSLSHSTVRCGQPDRAVDWLKREMKNANTSSGV